jgi:hypothetical protein
VAEKILTEIMKMSLLKALFFILVLSSQFSIGFCEYYDADFDDYEQEDIELVDWEGHLWYPYCLKHSLKGPESVSPAPTPKGMSGPIFID